MTTLDLQRRECGAVALPATLRFTWACVVDSDRGRRDGCLTAVVGGVRTDRPSLRLALCLDGCSDGMLDESAVEIDAAMFEDIVHVRVNREGAAVLTFVVDVSSGLRLLYLQSSLPGFAGLRGGTYDPPQLVHDTDSNSA